MYRIKFAIIIVSALSVFFIINTHVLSCPRCNLESESYYDEFRTKHNEYHILQNELDADSTHSYDALELSATFTPYLDEWYFDAQVFLTIRIIDDGLTTIPVHLAECMVDYIAFGQWDATWTHTEDVINITLPPNGADAGDTTTVFIEYTGLIRQDNVFGGMVYRPEHLTDVLYTFGEPYETRYWLACYDLPYDKLNATEINVILPEQYQVVSNGEFISRTEIGDDSILTSWRNTYPISTYLISIAAHPYIKIESGNYGVNEVPVNFWVFPEDSARAAFEFGRTGEMIEYFETIFGPYPFGKYDQAMAPIFNGWGAMEHQSCTTYGFNMVTYHDEWRRSEGIVAHELGHQWWGDMVGPLTFAEIWLNEGFASYSEALWKEYAPDWDLNELMHGFRAAYLDEDDRQLRYPIYDPPAGYLFGRAVYFKGAWVLHMLRWVVGDDNFFAGLTDYGQAYIYGSAITPEFQAIMEETSEMDLSDFFEQWVYDAGYPVYNFSNFATAGDEETGYSATIDLEQTQENAPIFTTPLPIKFFNDSTDTTVRIEVAEQFQQTLTVNDLPFEPVEYQFDPDRWILCEYFPNSIEEEQPGFIPDDYIISPAWPNPFNGITRFEVNIKQNTSWDIEIFDILGRSVIKLKEGRVDAGNYLLQWQPLANLSSGTYFISVNTPEKSAVRSITILK